MSRTMLERLLVRSLGIIDEVVLELSPGFVVLTGETGAGKSLLVESLKLLEGQRAQSDMVRSGDSRLMVEAWFAPPEDGEAQALLEEVGVPAADTMVIRREVAAEGRSRAWINDVTVTAATLQRLAPHLLAIHGQHEQHGLGDAAVQRRLVDEFGDHEPTLKQVQEEYRRWLERATEAQRLRDAQAQRRDRLDAIAFQLAEIAAVAPEAGEEEELRQRRLVLRHAVRLAELSGSLLRRLSEGDEAAVDQIARAERNLAEMTDCGLQLDASRLRLAEARVQIEEIVREVQELVRDIDDDPSELERVETRLHRLEQLTLKYGTSLAGVLERRESLEQERVELEQVQDRLQTAEKAEAEALKSYASAATTLQSLRHEAGRRLVQQVEEVLGGLNMAGTHLEMRWLTVADAQSPLEFDGRRVRFDAGGIHECELFIAPNPGEEPRPMARIASGGELSRLHLAIRSVLRGRHRASRLTMLFDEVDTGLGGGTAAALASLLAELAQLDQVMVVTHLPQVAARAENHFRVEKVVQQGRATTRVVALATTEREVEIARMLSGGHISASAREHARTLMEER